ncbi:phytanoyl-CoA dioxygenase family protein [Paenibacillus sp. CC-CFT747]|nr:phytanoyl-CoA dioxygenase family protein [Paenibacillus sp. CC-CFT747]
MSVNPRTPEEINRELYPRTGLYRALAEGTEIGEEEKRFYREQGFLGVQGFLTTEEIRNAVQALAEHINSDETKVKVQFTKPKSELSSRGERELSVRKVYDFVEEEERLRAIACKPMLLEAVGKLLGAKPKLVQDMALLKPPFGGEKSPGTRTWPMVRSPLTSR